MNPGRLSAGFRRARPALAARASLLAVLAAQLTSCGPPSRASLEQKLWSTDFEYRISPDIMPPRALEPIIYSVVVRDRKTREPIANGQGRIYATNADRKTIYDGFTYGPEVGTYHARLMFLTAGTWMMNVQFRLDSTKALQRPPDDWRQEVSPASDEFGPSTKTKP
ncbi:MAG: hypothetical protein ACHQQ3_02210 [Gemmatimonadales bacterium]